MQGQGPRQGAWTNGTPQQPQQHQPQQQPRGALAIAKLFGNTTTPSPTSSPSSSSTSASPLPPLSPRGSPSAQSSTSQASSSTATTLSTSSAATLNVTTPSAAAPSEHDIGRLLVAMEERMSATLKAHLEVMETRMLAGLERKIDERIERGLSESTATFVRTVEEKVNKRMEEAETKLLGAITQLNEKITHTRPQTQTEESEPSTRDRVLAMLAQEYGSSETAQSVVVSQSQGDQTPTNTSEAAVEGPKITARLLGDNENLSFPYNLEIELAFSGDFQSLSIDMFRVTFRYYDEATKEWQWDAMNEIYPFDSPPQPIPERVTVSITRGNSDRIPCKKGAYQVRLATERMAMAKWKKVGTFKISGTLFDGVPIDQLIDLSLHLPNLSRSSYINHPVVGQLVSSSDLCDEDSIFVPERSTMTLRVHVKPEMNRILKHAFGKLVQDPFSIVGWIASGGERKYNWMNVTRTVLSRKSDPSLPEGKHSEYSWIAMENHGVRFSLRVSLQHIELVDSKQRIVVVPTEELENEWPGWGTPWKQQLEASSSANLKIIRLSLIEAANQTRGSLSDAVESVIPPESELSTSTLDSPAEIPLQQSNHTSYYYQSAEPEGSDTDNPESTCTMYRQQVYSRMDWESLEDQVDEQEDTTTSAVAPTESPDESETPSEPQQSTSGSAVIVPVPWSASISYTSMAEENQKKLSSTENSESDDAKDAGEIQRPQLYEPMVVPGGARSPRTEVQPRDWNELFQRISSRATASPDQRLAQLKELAQLVAEFTEAATRVGKQIVEEVHLPPEEKKYPPCSSTVGGTAGGEKFVFGNIFFKFCLDVHGLYGGDEFASKAAGLVLFCRMLVSIDLNLQELNGMRSYFDFITQERPEFPLCVPLACLINYKGYRLFASSVLPIGGTQTLVYGSNDAARTVHADVGKLNEVMRQAGKFIGMKEHCVGSKRVRIAGPADIEVHRGDDGRFYVLDTARLYPPESLSLILAASKLVASSSSFEDVHLMFANAVPEIKELLHLGTESGIAQLELTDVGGTLFFTENWGTGQSANASRCNNAIASFMAQRPIYGDAVFIPAGQQGKVLYNLFRREYLRDYSRQYCPLSSDSFTGFGTHRARQHNTEVRAAYNHLMHTVVRNFVAALDSHMVVCATGYQLTQEMHKAGLNVRFLGLLHNLVKDSRTKELMRIEIITRSAKDILRAIMRRNSGDLLKVAVVEQLNLLIGQSPHSKLHWHAIVRCKIAAKFGSHCSEVTKVLDAIDADARSSIRFKRALLSRLQSHVGITLRQVPDSALMFKADPFDPEDLVDFVPLIDPLLHNAASVLDLWHSDEFLRIPQQLQQLQPQSQSQSPSEPPSNSTPLDGSSEGTASSLLGSCTSALERLGTWHRALGDDGFVSASAHLVVADAMRRCGQPDSAVRLLSSFLRSSSGSSSSSSASSSTAGQLRLEAYLSVRMRLGLLYEQIGDARQAEWELFNALLVAEEHLPSEHPAALVLLCNLARLLYSQKRYEELTHYAIHFGKSFLRFRFLVTSKHMEKLFANAPLLPIFVETIQFGFWQTASDKKHNFLHLDEEDRIQLALRPVTPEQRKQREPGYRAFVKSVRGFTRLNDFASLSGIVVPAQREYSIPNHPRLPPSSVLHRRLYTQYIAKIPLHLAPAKTLSLGPNFDILQEQPVEFLLSCHPNRDFHIRLYRCRYKWKSEGTGSSTLNSTNPSHSTDSTNSSNDYLPVDHRPVMHVREDLEEVAQMEGSLDGTKTMRFETAGMQAGDYQIRMDMKVLNLCILPRESGHDTPRICCIRTGEQRIHRLSQVFILPELSGKRITDFASVGALWRPFQRERKDLLPIAGGDWMPRDEQKPKFKCACWNLASTGEAMWSWGPASAFGILARGNQETPANIAPAPISALKDKRIEQLSVSRLGTHALAVSHSGTVWGWGDNSFGQTAQFDSALRTSPVLLTFFEGISILEVSCGEWCSAAVSTNGMLWTWGSNGSRSNGGSPSDVPRFSLGHGDCEVQSSPKRVERLAAHYVTSVRCSSRGFLALTNLGLTFMWGGIPVAASNASTSDRSPLDNNINILHPVLVHELAQEFVVAIAAGYAHFVALSRDGKIFTWGNGTYGQLGNGIANVVFQPRSTISPDQPAMSSEVAATLEIGIWQVKIPNTVRFVQIAACERITAALTDTSEVWWWGRGVLLPRCVRELIGKPVHQIFCGTHDVFATLGHGAPLVAEIKEMSAEQTLLRQQLIEQCPSHAETAPVHNEISQVQVAASASTAAATPTKTFKRCVGTSSLRDAHICRTCQPSSTAVCVTCNATSTVRTPAKICNRCDATGSSSTKCIKCKKTLSLSSIKMHAQPALLCAKCPSRSCACMLEVKA